MATKRLPRPRDPIQLGKLIVDIATGQVEDRVEDDRPPEWLISIILRSSGFRQTPDAASL
jgi:hypothetical protein